MGNISRSLILKLAQEEQPLILSNIFVLHFNLDRWKLCAQVGKCVHKNLASS